MASVTASGYCKGTALSNAWLTSSALLIMYSLKLNCRSSLFVCVSSLLLRCAALLTCTRRGLDRKAINSYLRSGLKIAVFGWQTGHLEHSQLHPMSVCTHQASSTLRVATLYFAVLTRSEQLLGFEWKFLDGLDWNTFLWGHLICLHETIPDSLEVLQSLELVLLQGCIKIFHALKCWGLYSLFSWRSQPLHTYICTLSLDMTSHRDGLALTRCVLKGRR